MQQASSEAALSNKMHVENRAGMVPCLDAFSDLSSEEDAVCWEACPRSAAQPLAQRMSLKGNTAGRFAPSMHARTVCRLTHTTRG